MANHNPQGINEFPLTEETARKIMMTSQKTILTGFGGLNMLNSACMSEESLQVR